MEGKRPKTRGKIKGFPPEVQAAVRVGLCGKNVGDNRRPSESLAPFLRRFLRFSPSPRRSPPDVEKKRGGVIEYPP